MGVWGLALGLKRQRSVLDASEARAAPASSSLRPASFITILTHYVAYNKTPVKMFL